MFQKQLSLLLVGLLGLVSANVLNRGSTSSQYIHSNDTISLTLAERQTNTLHGTVGSEHTLEFVLVNRGPAGHFSFEGSSEDNFMGLLSIRDVYLAGGQQQTITVSNMRVPQRPEGSRVRYTLTVEKDDGYSKREAPPSGPQNPGGVGGVGGQQGPGGSGGNFLGNNNNNVNDYLNGFLSRDPTYRREVAITVEFAVESEMNDDSKPWTQLTYGADSKDDTCSMDPEDSNCNTEMWWVKIRASDEKSGLNSITAMATGASSQYDEIFFRYVNFPIGTTLEQELVAAASCCVESMTIRIRDVEGNTAEVEAENGGKGTPMSDSLKWGLIGGGIALILILVLVGFFCYKKKYAPVSQG